MQNNIEKGIQFAQKRYEIAQNATSISFRGYSTVLLAEAYFLAGNMDESIKKIEELEEMLLKHHSLL